MSDALEQLRYPIGRFSVKPAYTAEDTEFNIQAIANLPKRLHQAVAHLSDAQLETPYRPNGWTVRQVVHHLADSHINSYIRFKWTLTEDTPTIKAYDEVAWADLHEATSAPVHLSLELLSALHARWTVVMKSLDEAQLQRGFVHPETGELSTLATAIAHYAWHGEHHLTQITSLIETCDW